MGRGWCVLLALKIPADRIQADIGGHGRSVVLYQDIPVDLTEPCFARPQIILAQEIAANLDARACEAALRSTVPDLKVSTHRDRTFEQREGTMIG
jgi:hypothetical protein